MKKTRAVLPVLLMLLSFNLYAQSNQYKNPILAGFYPDPSICRVDSNFYLINSTFAYYPGLPVFHSTDLVNWKQIGNAIDRPEQLEYSGAGVSRGLFAPDISYHDGTFYIVCTMIDKGGNFVITAKDPAGPWSNPVYLKDVLGIDPALFFDGNKAYIVYNSDAPDNKPAYSGHRTIRIRPFDFKALKTFGDERILVNGGSDFSKKPIWIEGPHIYKHNDWYYLSCAEGGTGYNHTQVVFRTQNIDSNFIPFSGNPILTQKNLDPNRQNPVTTVGHVDFVTDKNNNWHAVFLGCRPYEGDYYNTGRETFLLPVVWENGWPIILKEGNTVSYKVATPYNNKVQNNHFNGNYSFSDQFATGKLNSRFMMLRNPKQNWYNIHNGLNLALQPTTVAGTENPSFIGFRQAHINSSASTLVLFSAKNNHEKAGITIFQNEKHFAFFALSEKDGQAVLELQLANNDTPVLVKSIPLKTRQPLHLKIESGKKHYRFFYSFNGKNWTDFGGEMDAKIFSTKQAGGFVGALYGMYATGNVINTSNKATFKYFKYKGHDETFQ